MPSCLILSDSTLDFSSFQAKVERVQVVPFHYTDARGSFSGDDDLFSTMGSHEFYDAIRSGAELMTSQPSQLEFEELFSAVRDSGDEAVLFCISTGISGGYNGAHAALGRICEQTPEFRKRIFVVDTLAASTPMHLLVYEACRMRDRGFSAREIYEWALGARWCAQTLFMVDDLDALRRGGRIPKSVAAAGDVLRVKPLLHFDLEGKLGMVGVARSRKKGLAKLAKFYQTHHIDPADGPIAAIGDADAPYDGDALAALLKERYPELRVLRSTIGPTIGCHVGPGMVSCCLWGRDRRVAKAGA